MKQKPRNQKQGWEKFVYRPKNQGPSTTCSSIEFEDSPQSDKSDKIEQSMKKNSANKQSICRNLHKEAYIPIP